METKRKVGITLCSVSLGIEVILLGFVAFLYFYFVPLPLIIGGLCIAMIVVQCKNLSPKVQLIMSIIALVVAVLQFLMPVAILLIISYSGPSSDSDAVGYIIILFILIPVMILSVAVVVLLSVNVKMAHDMNKAGGAPNQSVVYVIAEDGTQQAMVVQQMN